MTHDREEGKQGNPVCEECNLMMIAWSFDGDSGYSCGGCGWSIDNEWPAKQEPNPVHPVEQPIVAELRNDGWISVKDRLPKAGEDVLCSSNGYVYCGFKALDDEDSNQWYLNGVTDRDGDMIDVYDITHWQLLPEPPKAD
jgi:hypothetical protein